MKLTGKVKTGLGEASYWVGKIKNIFEKKYSMKLYLGTLNIQLEHEYILEQGQKIKASEYGGNLDVLIKECEIMGNKGYIVRTERNNQKGGDHPLNIIEVVSDIPIRDEKHLKDDDEVIVLIKE